MEAPPLFPEASAEDDDDSESTLAKKRDKRFESKDDDKEPPKRISLENLFVREEINPDDENQSTDMMEIFSRDTQSSSESEPAEVTETVQSPEDGDLEQLDEEEARYAVEAIATERTENLQHELEQAEPGSSEEAEVLAGAAFVENLLDRISSGEAVDESTLDAAAAEAAQDIGAEEAQQESASEDAEDTTENDDTATSSLAAPASGGSSGAGIPPTPTAPSAAGSGSGGIPPRPHAGLPGGTPPPAGAVQSGAVGAPAGSTAIERSTHEHGDSHSHVKYVLVGGVVGYMLGRRRGRIKTESRLLPIQHKLEKQVGDLTGQIAEREMSVRTLARQQYENQAFDSRAVVENLNKKNEKRQERAKTPPVMTPEQIVSSSQEHVPLAAAAAEYRRPAENKQEKSVETMMLAELLQVAGGIEINGQSVKSIFEAGRIDTPALRRIIKEYMHNGDFKKELMQSMKPEVYGSPEEGEERRPEAERHEDERKPSRPTDEQEHNQYAHLDAADEAPRLQALPDRDNSSKSTDMTRKIIYGAGATVAVILLALIVGGLLLLVI